MLPSREVPTVVVGPAAEVDRVFEVVDLSSRVAVGRVPQMGNGVDPGEVRFCAHVVDFAHENKGVFPVPAIRLVEFGNVLGPALGEGGLKVGGVDKDHTVVLLHIVAVILEFT